MPKKVVNFSFAMNVLSCIVFVKVMFNTAVHAEFIRDHKDYCFEFQNDSHSFNWKYSTAITSYTRYIFNFHHLPI